MLLKFRIQTDAQIIENDSTECIETDNRYRSSSTELDILTDESISSASSVEDKEEEHTFQKDTFKTFDSRRQQGLSFTIKWEKKIPWAYYSSNKVGKTCEEYSDTGDQYWKTLLQKHDEHPYLFFTEHIESTKHIQSVKKKVKQILKKGGIVRQMLKGVENKTAKEKQNSRKLVNKFIKTAYFIAKKKMGSKK